MRDVGGIIKWLKKWRVPEILLHFLVAAIKKGQLKFFETGLFYLHDVKSINSLRDSSGLFFITRFKNSCWLFPEVRQVGSILIEDFDQFIKILHFINIKSNTLVCFHLKITCSGIILTGRFSFVIEGFGNFFPGVVIDRYPFSFIDDCDSKPFFPAGNGGVVPKVTHP